MDSALSGPGCAKPAKRPSEAESCLETEWQPEAGVKLKASSPLDSYSESELESESESPLQMLPQPSPQQQRLNNKGYVCLHRYVPREMCDGLLLAAQGLDESAWSCLFGHGGKMDDKRKSAKAPVSLTKDVASIIEPGFRTFFPDAEPRDWTFLKSLPNGKAQPAHRDFLPLPANQDLYDYTRLPASLMIGLEDQSSLYGYGWNRQVALEAEKEVITYGKGDVLIFRSDFIHGGCGYERQNIRLHCFLDPKEGTGKVRKSNSIDFIRVIPKKLPMDEKSEQTCFVFNCGLTFSSGPALRKHIRGGHNILFNAYPETIVQPSRRGGRCKRSRNSTAGASTRVPAAEAARMMRKPT